MIKTNNKSLVKISEADNQNTIVDLLRAYGYKVAHFRTSLTNKGDYLTAYMYDTKGFPDLIAINNKIASMIVVECKDATNTVEPEQHDWLKCFASVCKDVYILRPDDFDDLKNRLDTIKLTHDKGI